MSKTVIIYQCPDAYDDVIRWGKELEIDLVPDDNMFYVHRKDEYIEIYPNTHLDHLPMFCNKLVLWGSFSKNELLTIIDSLEIENE